MAYAGLGIAPLAVAATAQTVNPFKIDLKSPSQHIKERSATIAALAAAAMNGDNNAWAQLWLASSRLLPVRAVDTVPRNEGKDCKPGGCQTSGKKFPCAAGCTTQPFHGLARVGDVAEDALHEVEAVRGIPLPGNTVQGQPSGSFPPIPAGSSPYSSGASPLSLSLGSLGNPQLLASLGFVALAFILRER